MSRVFLLIFSLVGAAAQAQPFYTYVGALDAHAVTLAWGTRNDIGRTAKGVGPVTVSIGGRQLQVSRSWVRVEGLEADRDYTYTVRRGQTAIGQGTVRTWPEQSDSLVFFVIGDWGNGTSQQREIARRMTEERARLEREGKQVRFVLSTGDNLYGRFAVFGISPSSGMLDREWEDRFFQPYREILRSIPFYAVPGNHDGNESENQADLEAYLDNFFFPTPEPARWYQFQFGDLAQFLSLDSTRNTLRGPPAPVYESDGEQSKWLKDVLSRPSPPWRIVWMHHPMFTAGPEHDSKFPELRHWFDAFRQSGVQVVFAGHEHNLQISERSERTGYMQFVVSGAGGQLRGEDVRRRMNDAQIAAWAPSRHFLIVEMTREEMRITPVGAGPVRPVDAGDKPVALPFRVPRVLN